MLHIQVDMFSMQLSLANRRKLGGIQRYWSFQFRVMSLAWRRHQCVDREGMAKDRLVGCTSG